MLVLCGATLSHGTRTAAHAAQRCGSELVVVFSPPLLCPSVTDHLHGLHPTLALARPGPDPGRPPTAPTPAALPDAAPSQAAGPGESQLPKWF